ncbi:hypothetical protein [Thiobacillus denitrificans]|nr:hypothetical protein [Thiobacillus denitrificans]
MQHDIRLLSLQGGAMTACLQNALPDVGFPDTAIIFYAYVTASC